MKPTMPVVTKCLILAMILAISVQAHDVLPRVSGSPSAPLPHPPPNKLNCDQECSTQCAEKRIFRMMLCYGVCMAKCTILPLDDANFPCTQNSVVNTLHTIRDEKHVDAVVNPCNSKCS